MKKNSEKKVLTPEEFKEQLRNEGITLKEWAEEHDFDPNYASKVLNGMVKGNRGIGHKIALKMSIK